VSIVCTCFRASSCPSLRRIHVYAYEPTSSTYPSFDHCPHNFAAFAMATSHPDGVHISSHPCLRAKLSQLRSSSTNAADTKRLVHDISTIIACEALGDILATVEIGTASPPSSHPADTG